MTIYSKDIKGTVVEVSGMYAKVETDAEEQHLRILWLHRGPFTVGTHGTLKYEKGFNGASWYFYPDPVAVEG